jgi:hypothetical protein
MNNQQEERLLQLQRQATLTSAEKSELNRLQNAMDSALNRGAKRAESGQTGTRGAMNPTRPEARAKGGVVGSASKRADGIAQRGTTKGKLV